MKTTTFILAILAAFFINAVSAQTVMRVAMVTGNDDLRGGNEAFVTVNFSDGTSSREYSLGGGFGNGRSTTLNITLPRTVLSMADVQSVVLRHDGKPRSGNAFDTYDNWNLNSIKVTFDIRNTPNTCINESGSPLQRFTGDIRNRTFVPKCGGPATGGPTSFIKVYLTTGSDDLRGGNNAYIKINYMNGTSSPEFTLGGDFQQNTAVAKKVDLLRVVSNISEIKSVSVRHDGSPRGGQPFDTYDNWDLQMLRVALVMPNGTETNIVNLNANPLVRFTGDLRSKVYNRVYVNSKQTLKL